MFNGGFSASYPNGIDQDAYYQASGTFAYIEQTEIPLMLLGQTQNQTFVAYDWSASRAAGKKQENLTSEQQYILKYSPIAR